MSRIVYGLRPVSEALRARSTQVSAIFVAAGSAPQGRPSPALRWLLLSAERAGVAVVERARPQLDLLCASTHHQGVAAVVGDYAYADPDDLLAAAEQHGEPPLLLVLDSVQDPHHLGALLRSAHVLGAHGLIIPQDRAAQVTPAVVKASSGASEHSLLARVVNLARCLGELKQRGLWIVGAVAATDAGVLPPWQVDFSTPLAVVLGSEGRGLRPLVEKSCDLRVAIPMVGEVESLSVSAAGAALLYEARRQRSAAQAPRRA
jgi:23S rRNA (guanosine2251-2'-O)-methyltransferase